MARSISKSSGKGATGGKSFVMNPKLQEDKMGRLNDFVPTKSQKECINTIIGNTLTFVDAAAGTGKSSSILWHYCKEYLADRYKEIMVIRTPVEFNEDTIGFLQGDLTQKTEVHFLPAKQILEKFLGAGAVAADRDTRIHFTIPNFQLGATWTDKLVIIDEAQQLSPQVLKLLLERIGEGTTVVVAGDSNQILQGNGKRNALADAINRFFVEDPEGFLSAKFPHIGFHSFTDQECQRHPVVQSVITAYSN